MKISKLIERLESAKAFIGHDADVTVRTGDNFLEFVGALVKQDNTIVILFKEVDSKKDAK